MTVQYHYPTLSGPDPNHISTSDTESPSLTIRLRSGVECAYMPTGSQQESLTDMLSGSIIISGVSFAFYGWAAGDLIPRPFLLQWAAF